MSRSITIIREARVGVPGLMLESMGMRQLYEAVSSDEDSKKSFMGKLWEKFRDSSLVDIGLDMLGLFGGAVGAFLAPGSAGISAIIAMIPDLINAFRRFARGDKFGGALSLICAIPFAGDAAAFFIRGEKALVGGGKATLAVIKTLAEWSKGHAAAVRTIQTGTGKIASVVTEHLPGMERHHDDIVAAVGTLTSGDKGKMMQLAKESGIKIAAREAGVDLDDETVAKVTKRPRPPKDDADSDSDRALAESTIRRSRRSHKISDLYAGILY
jgi:hypothetical protein